MMRTAVIAVLLVSGLVSAQPPDWTRSVHLSNVLVVDIAENFPNAGDEYREGVFHEIARALDFDEGQRSALKDLWTAYAAVIEQYRRNMRDFERSVRLAQMFGESVEESERLRSEAWTRQGRAIEAQRGRLIEDVRALLTTDQLDQWPLAEGIFRRERALRHVSGPGVRLSISRLVAGAIGVRIAPPELESIMAEYDAAVNALAVKVEAVVRDRDARTRGLTGNEWTLAYVESASPLIDLAESLAQTNRSYARRVRMVLEGEALLRFERDFRTRAINDGYEYRSDMINVDQVLRAIDGLEAPPAQRAALDAERAGFARELGRLTESEFDDHLRTGFEEMRKRPLSSYMAPPRYEQRKAELRLYVDYLGRVRKLLSAEQLRLLPDEMHPRSLTPPSFPD